ncbi:Replication factor C subunit 4, RFC4 [Monocercomonoides exilis]|uniref:Replication factor C subunit 4, RFC4 n=1 Tax=Monocercomonoides exilis TaxID=2049356 RepID=UPI00355A3A25|nr:Replication factor C subunit 4, RFC4 [Monocercomonoides exilis]|eukprot:MONOS_11344.1-p1 / transcript=MONOS_11344.1 / gene=MONOS_11344 / organism=Monocercomonoides_exilis_PA203 / gene_product=Replication factor C subunit 4, RFC4 / transcript_product=Replication factor C subunit 4, RFC4 / location=Mono_scaffold00564:15867-17327(-) / protein_length=339 / sequence_SO=supercontig / SO=protein_coding / is_pseudo=false
MTEFRSRRHVLVPWVEKFRPKSLKDVVSQDVLVASLHKFIEAGTLPHLLFYGPPGTGKTSVILALAHDLFGPEMFRQRVMELNASDERGIDAIREKVKRFAQQSISAKPEGYPFPCPPFKLIILDEADSLTTDAQNALRRVIEVHTRVTRFCLICNYVSKIIDPLASRCAKSRFFPLPKEISLERLKHICNTEGVKCGDEELIRLNELSKGDLRRAITLLHSAHRLYRDDITIDGIMDMAGIVPQEIIDELIGCVIEDHSYDHLASILNTIKRKGYSAQQVLEQTIEEIIKNTSISDAQKAQIGYQTAQTEKALLDGANEEMQLKSLFSFILSLTFKG